MVGGFGGGGFPAWTLELRVSTLGPDPIGLQGTAKIASLEKQKLIKQIVAEKKNMFSPRC